MKEVQAINNDTYAFFRKPSGKIGYYPKCVRCARTCKQSWRVKWLSCPKFKKAG